MKKTDFFIIGAGPAGSICSGILNKKGLSVTIVEKNSFPRFSIGESFLPQNYEFYEEAGLANILDKSDFQIKKGALFVDNTHSSKISFEEKSIEGPNETIQVERSIFDEKVSNELQSKGVEIIFNAEVKTIDQNYSAEYAKIEFTENLETKVILAKYIIDASGFARVLPRLLKQTVHIEKNNRSSVFNHIKTKFACNFDLSNILISNSKKKDSWFWLIPINENLYSIGFTKKEIDRKTPLDEVLSNEIKEHEKLNNCLPPYEFVYDTKIQDSYTSKIESSFGEKYIVIGNSLEFIDPVFSSGVTIAGKSASLAANALCRKLKGEEVDFKLDYEVPLMKGVNVFRSFVQSWYDGSLKKIIFAKEFDSNIRSHIISVLAGYAWDEKNYFAKKTLARLQALSKLIKAP